LFDIEHERERDLEYLKKTVLDVQHKFKQMKNVSFSECIYGNFVLKSLFRVYLKVYNNDCARCAYCHHSSCPPGDGEGGSVSDQCCQVAVKDLGRFLG